MNKLKDMDLTSAISIIILKDLLLNKAKDSNLDKPKDLNLNQNVIRHISIKVKEFDKTPTQLSKEPE